MTRTETKGETKRTTKIKQSTSNSSNLWKKLVHKFFPWAQTLCYFYGCVFLKRGLIPRFSFVQE